MPRKKTLAGFQTYPIVKKKNGWYFYQEDYNTLMGPYKTEIETALELGRYCEQLNIEGVATQRQPVTDETIQEWYKKPFRITTTANSYEHTEESAIHLTVAAAYHAAKEAGRYVGVNVDNEAVMIGFMRTWSGIKGAFSIKYFNDLLYPARAYKFKRKIDRDVFEQLQEEAKEMLIKQPLCPPDNRRHLEGIIKGKAPFGFRIVEDGEHESSCNIL